MANFDDAVTIVLKNEGDLVDSPNDPGGLTNKGISLRFLLNIPIEHLKSYGINSNDENHLRDYIKSLNDDQAKAIYKGEFWDHAPFDKINKQTVANYIFDAAVNMGIATAIKIAQRAINAINASLKVLDDGIMGTQTLEELNHGGYVIMPALRSERAAEYRLIAQKNPDQRSDLQGWLNRAYIG